MRGSTPLDALRSAPVTAMIWLRGVSAGACAGGTGVGLPGWSWVLPGVAGGVVLIVRVRGSCSGRSRRSRDDRARDGRGWGVRSYTGVPVES
jgi:hypothetical protein